METQTLQTWEFRKAVLREKFTVIHIHIKKNKRTQPNFIPQGTKKEHTKPNISKSKETTKIRA